MRNLFVLLMIISSVFPSCQNEDNSSSFEPATIEPSLVHSYNEIEDKKIHWNDVFNPQKEHYFVYFYTLTCSHCNELKNQIIEYGLTSDNIYFVQDSEDVKIEKNVDSTIGIKDSSNLSIKGFPSIIEIEKKTLIKNVAGINDIISILNL